MRKVRYQLNKKYQLYVIPIFSIVDDNPSYSL